MYDGRIIEGDWNLNEGSAWLQAREPRFTQALRRTGPLPLRRHQDGFPALLDAIIGQQVSTGAAAAMRAKLERANLWNEEAVADCTEGDLRACGLSRQKIRYVQALARARLDYDALRLKSDSDVIATLTSVPGIGRWTAEIYAMFALGRADVFAAGDLALQESARALFELPSRPKENALRIMAEAWSPWRAVAARALWAYYRVIKDREGIR